MRAVVTVLEFALTIVAACLIGFGVPLAWIWIGSQLQGDSGATSTSFSVAMVILFGIIFSYVAVLYLPGAVMSMFHTEPAPGDRTATARNPWMRGQTDTRQRTRQEKIGGIERVFVVTTVIVTCAFWLWFAFEAGSPLPNQ